MSFDFSILASEFEFAITLCENLKVAAGKPIGGSNIAMAGWSCTVFVMVDETLDEPSGILPGKRAARPETISVEPLVDAYHVSQ